MSDKIANYLGNIGRCLVFIGMLSGCILLWYLVVRNIAQ